uniref:DNA 5'-3' helicase n=1 Tax=Cacopsylla melanoneura TaxID=428564 RepID=A0A8D8SCX9_9HEMI
MVIILLCSKYTKCVLKKKISFTFQLEIEIDESIILLDEAHNIEEWSRDAGSGSFSLNDINATLQECEQLGNIGLPKFKSSLSQWVDANASTKKGTVSWSGSDFVTSFENHGMGPDECDKHFKTCLSQINSSEDELPGDNIEFILGLFFKNCDDYHVCLESAVSLDQGDPMSKRITTFHFWCLNSALMFADIRNKARSVILTSGTLGPVDSFQSELGTQFPIKLEANHVIDKDQVFIGALGRGPTNFPLIATYKNRQDNDFQDELGRLVLGVCEIVPYGVLCFLPSYAYLKQLFKRWSSTGLMNQISKHKSVFREPRSNKEPEDIMQKYFAAIKQAEQNVNTNTGALLFAVFRGKISEGIDFPDNCARSVISVGIPFPSVQDEKVKLKKVYNDTHSQKKGLLKGGDWYQIQAFRALNQGLGRCIRHRKDWGAILLVDLRFNSFQEKLSKWVRNQVQLPSSYSSCMENLKTFVEKHRKEIQQKEERFKLEEDNLNEEKAENNDTLQSDNASSSPAKTEGTCDTQDTASSVSSTNSAKT